MIKGLLWVLTVFAVASSVSDLGMYLYSGVPAHSTQKSENKNVCALLASGAAPLILRPAGPPLFNRRVLCVKGCQATFAVVC